MIKICVIGLGYVGLPICLKLAETFEVVGYDINKNRVLDLSNGIDKNDEFSKNEIKKNRVFFTNNLINVKNVNFYIICVPTPIDKRKKPNLEYVKESFNLISRKIKKDDIVILESTVYPGVTGKFTKFLESKSKLKNNIDFHICYSPERINPGDKKNKLTNIKKILAYEGRNLNIKKNLFKVYNKICKKIIFSRNIKEAETAKGIENIQRDLNIALFNEILLICNSLKINFNEVIKLASSKWNFLKFEPGLVGGHCLPVDPYYLTYIAKKNNYASKVTLSGREVNDHMKDYVIKFTENFIKLNSKKKQKKICIMGLTYKYGVSDTRNSQKIEIFNHFKKKYKKTKAYDPYLYGFNNISKGEIDSFDFILFLSKGKKFEIISKKINKKKTIDPFFYF